MKALIILNDAPYGNERPYNGFRLAIWLSKQEGTSVKIFLIGDAVGCAKSGQKVPQGYYSTQVMIENVVKRAGVIGACSTCMDARGITDDELVNGVHRSSMDELTEWSLESDKVFTF